MRKLLACTLCLLILSCVFMMPLPLEAGNRDLSFAVYTPNGTFVPQDDVPVQLAKTELNGILNNEAIYIAKGAERLADVDPTFNCFAYAMYERDPDKHAVWLSFPDPFIEDQSYIEIDHPVVGCIVLYRMVETMTLLSPTGPLAKEPTVYYTHGAVVVDILESEDGVVDYEDVICVSKWGQGSIIRHSMDNCTYYPTPEITVALTKTLYLSRTHLEPLFFVINPDVYSSLPMTDETAGETTVGAKDGLYRDADSVVRFYRDGIPQYAGLVMDDEGQYYYINSTGEAVTNGDYPITQFKANGLLAEGVYSFGEDGRMTTLPEPLDGDDVRNGLVRQPDGRVLYLAESIPQHHGAALADDGTYYYINSTLKGVTGSDYAIGGKFTNHLLPAGGYTFDEAAVMGGLPVVIDDSDPDDPANGLLRCTDGRVLFCENGEPQYAGLVSDAEGYYYYINSALSAVTGEYGVKPDHAAGLLDEPAMLSFGEDGRLLDTSPLLGGR